MKTWWNVLDLLEDNVLFLQLWFSLQPCQTLDAFVFTANWSEHSRRTAHIWICGVSMCGYDGVVHSYVKIALGSNSDSCLSVYVCVCVLILDHWIMIECNEPQTDSLFAWWEEIKERDFILMEAELMNQSAEGYRFNNIGIIYVLCKLNVCKMWGVCFFFYWGVCFFLLQRTAL